MPSLMNFDRDKFWKGYRNTWGRVNQPQVEAIEFLLSAFEKSSAWKDVRHIAYALATIKHETAGTFRPITEYGGRKYFDKYDTGRLAERLGNTPEKDGDGFLYRGRGYVQITGRANYRKFRIDDNPELALDSGVAFAILTDGMHKGMFTGHKLSDHIQSLDCDYKNARKIINGRDMADLIAGYAKAFEKVLRDAEVKKPQGSAMQLGAIGAVSTISAGFYSGYWILVIVGVVAAICIGLYLYKKASA